MTLGPTGAGLAGQAFSTDESRLARHEVRAKDPSGVTIVIPNWNHRHFLVRAIRRAMAALASLTATGFAGEVIVIDDASRDGSQRLLRSLEQWYGDPRLQTVFLETNLGLPRVRNLGLRLARYRYAIPHDADNELAPENLPLFLKSIQETEGALVHGNLLRRRAGEIVGIQSGEVATMGLLRSNYIDAFALVDAEKVLAAGGYITAPELHGWEDWELILHLIALEEQLVFVPAVLGYYDLNPKSMRELARRGPARPRRPLEEDPRYYVLQRLYAQMGPLDWLPGRVGRIYHPEVGYLDDWSTR